MCAVAALTLAMPAEALSHSQLFLKAQMSAVASAEGKLVEIRSVWRYEPTSASAIREQFDRDSDGSLDDAERQMIAHAVREMSSPFTTRIHLVRDGREISLSSPNGVRVDVLGRELMISFSIKPVSRERMGGKIALWADDQEQSSVLDFADDGDMKVSGSAWEPCDQNVVRPGIQTAPRNQVMATDMFFGDPQARDRPKLTSTRLEIDCPR